MQDLDFQSIDKYLSSNLIGYKGPSEFKKFSTVRKHSMQV